MLVDFEFTCLLWNLCRGQEAMVRTGHGTKDWFQIRKGIHQCCILSPCLFHLHAEYIMWNVRLHETQAGIKVAGRNINNLKYTGDTIFMAESEEEQKSHLMKVKEENENVGLILFSFIFISWRLTTLQYCSGFCHILT